MIDNKLHYLWKKKMQYLHGNLNMHTTCGGKMLYPHYDHNPHYIWEREMQYLNNHLKMHTICG
jgi:endo-1,4-beta-mannosidase